MKYFLLTSGATIYETLRYSSLSLLGVPHAAVKDTDIDGFCIPKGKYWIDVDGIELGWEVNVFLTFSQ